MILIGPRTKSASRDATLATGFGGRRPLSTWRMTAALRCAVQRSNFSASGVGSCDGFLIGYLHFAPEGVELPRESQHMNSRRSRSIDEWRPNYNASRPRRTYETVPPRTRTPKHHTPYVSVTKHMLRVRSAPATDTVITSISRSTRPETVAKRNQKTIASVLLS